MPSPMTTRRARAVRWLAALLTLLWSMSGQAAGFEVISAATKVDGEVYRLTAQIEYRFSNAALEALENGVPLVVEIEMEVRRRRPWLWDEAVYALAQRFQLEYHALSRQYVVSNLNSGELSPAGPQPVGGGRALRRRAAGLARP
jgi:Domain of unknown function (DUF4390)